MASPSPESPQSYPEERPFLTPEQVAFFHENGYLLIPEFLSENDMQNMKAAIVGQLDKFDPQEHRSVFTTVEQKRVVDAYFLESGDKIRYFFEEDAFDATGELVSDKYHVINKIGHDLHDLDPVFKQVSYDPRINSIARSLGSKQPLIAQSMYIFKQPRIGGEVKPHQDATFLYTEPQSVLGFWWPLENCTKQNGCLWAVPGSHKLPVFQHFRRTADSSSCEMIPPTAEPFNIEGAVPLEIERGTLVLIHHSLVHYSEANSSSSSRQAYTIHLIDGTTKYPESNWLQRPADNWFKGFE